jgi:2-iminobutanoate/2-iminopropanoate deaminase
MREVISTKNAPPTGGPYSQAIKANGFIFVAGQIAVDPAAGEIGRGDVQAQADQILRSISAILEAAGSSLANAVQSRVFLKNMNDFDAMNETYKKFFSTAPPARTTVEVARLPKDVLIEIDMVAVE